MREACRAGVEVDVTALEFFVPPIPSPRRVAKARVVTPVGGTDGKLVRSGPWPDGMLGPPFQSTV